MNGREARGRAQHVAARGALLAAHEAGGRSGAIGCGPHAGWLGPLACLGCTRSLAAASGGGGLALVAAAAAAAAASMLLATLPPPGMQWPASNRRRPSLTPFCPQ